MVTKKALIAIVLVAAETFSITIKTHAPFFVFLLLIPLKRRTFSVKHASNNHL
jgi:hypothetical protein